jgi:hypothetical protein
LRISILVEQRQEKGKGKQRRVLPARKSDRTQIVAAASSLFCIARPPTRDYAGGG